jgi:hypothetical protein
MPGHHGREGCFRISEKSLDGEIDSGLLRFGPVPQEGGSDASRRENASACFDVMMAKKSSPLPTTRYARGGRGENSWRDK